MSIKSPNIFNALSKPCNATVLNMAGMYLHTSNKMELLINGVAALMDTDPLPPLIPEIIVIPSAGMERYLCRTLAKTCGICAHVQFPFPNALVHDLFSVVYTDLEEHAAFEPQYLCWKVMELLPTFLDHPLFLSLKQYIRDDKDSVKLFQLSKKIAELFDHYTVYRPDMIHNWNNNTCCFDDASGEQWQFLLWQSLCEVLPQGHRVIRGQEFPQALDQAIAAGIPFPSRILFFGMSHLPHFHQQIIHACSVYCDMHFFVVNPCQEFWDDIVTEKQHLQHSLRQKKRNKHSENLHYETGNSLLASMGKLGKEFLAAFHTAVYYEDDSFLQPPQDSMLTCIQSDILNLRMPQTPRPVAISDHSIQIHVCHSAQREIEVLHDMLLSFFDQDPSLTPDDIIVMSPSIEAYVPFIQTVFDVSAPDTAAIPYTIADRSRNRINSIVSGFFAILDCNSARFGVSHVLSILENASVQKKRGFSSDDIARIQTWVADTRIHWGLDFDMRKKLGVYPCSDNTWHAGLSRLFLGYAMGADDTAIFKNTIPYQGIPEESFELLGKCTRFMEDLSLFAQRCNQCCTLTQWSKLLLEMIDTFFDSDASVEDPVAFLRTHITDKVLNGSIVDYEQEVPFAVIRTALESAFASGEYGKGFLSGGVTFGTLLPMRSIPFKIICLIGMNDGDFPRKDIPVSFDLIATHPRTGDRTKRHDDRYCFLESLIAARSILYISHVGRTIDDNSPIPPSVLVDELIDYCEKHFAPDTPHADTVRSHMCTDHLLSAFHPNYFTASEKGTAALFSYSREHCAAAQAGMRKSTPAPFIDTPLPLPTEYDWRTLSVDQLCRFFIHPVRYFCEHRLGIIPPRGQTLLQDKEAFSLEGLDRYLLEQQVFGQDILHTGQENIHRYLKALGMLPHGAVGESTFHWLCETIDQFSRSIHRIIPSIPHNAFADIDLSVGMFRITGRVRNCTDQYLVHVRPAQIKAKDRIRMWLCHLLVNACADRCVPAESLLIGRDERGDTQALLYKPCPDAGLLLEKILNLYQQGLQIPLAFYPDSSCAYAQALTKEKSSDYIHTHIARIWQGDPHTPGESSDIYYRYYPGPQDPFTESFFSCARSFFQPLLASESEVAV